ncbi:hypothetical protein G7Y89_g700 [Cudoniella acicularis]|uniref:Arrestin-like N-terminal domain-containing protein n=1 Tax=Cudoniella acicularis TaxID=354080 RepID=A0A8H4WA67_9HELO|nr:hypothetical protein G7Y89_g700 [Cudoniella acicularis]
MALEIKIYHVRDTKVFYGGDEVSGHVELWGPAKHSELTVEINFQGFSETMQIIKNHQYDDKAIFFQSSQPLFKGEVDIERGIMKIYPFKFQLPVETEPDGGNAKIKYNTSRRFPYAKGPHPLPPSCAFSGDIVGRPYKARVSYTLNASAVGKAFVPRRKLGTITVVPPPSTKKETAKDPANGPLLIAVPSKIFTQKSSRLLPGQAQHRRSVGGWLGDTFTSNTPKAIFTIVARTPQALTAGQDIPIQLMLQYDAEKSTLPSAPEVMLTQLKYKIKANTDIASRGRFGAARYANPRETVFKRTLNFASMPLSNGENVDIGIWSVEDGGMTHIKFEQAIVSPFNTYNICRKYEVQIAITFECAGKKTTAVFAWKPLDIVYNEGYGEGPQTRFGPVGDNALQGAAAVVRVLATTAVVLATVLS